MPRPNPTEYKQRKAASALRCLDKDGKPLRPESASVAVQDKRDVCDINRIVKKATRQDGQVDVSAVLPLSKGSGIYGDFTGAVDFQEQCNRVIRVNDAFNSLKPEVRLKFNNDPAQMIAFLDKAKTDETAREEAVSLGLLAPPEIKWRREDLPNGSFWVQTKDGVEIKREPIKTAAPSPGA